MTAEGRLPAAPPPQRLRSGRDAVACRRVALLIESSNAYGRGLLAGVYDHTSASESWITFLPEHGRGEPPLPWLRSWRGDGILARIENERIADVVTTLGLPAIDVSAARLLPGLPYVETDDAAIARLAATHLREIGLRSFAFCGNDRFTWSGNRLRAFTEEMERHGHAVDAFVLHAGGNGAKRRAAEDGDADLSQWLSGLPKPVGVFACYDGLGRRVIDVCHAASIAVPEEVAVIGVDDDDLLCRLSKPPLSSVIPDARGAGRLAAELLDRVLDGGQVPGGSLLAPRGIVVRQSTDILAADDPLLAAASRFIRENISQGIKVENVAAAVGVGRRALETRFSRAIGRTPHEEIARVQFRLVEDLLRHSELKLATIARRCGFRHTEYMTAAFTKRYGMSPREWRQSNQG